MSQPPVGESQQPLAGASTLLGTNHLQTSIDSLKTTIDHLNQGLSPLVAQLHQTNRMTRASGMGGIGAFPTTGWWGNNGGQGPLGGGQQPPRNANGGGATFNGGQP